MSDPRDEFLKNVDFCQLGVREYPKIAFLCGGNPDVISVSEKQSSPSVWKNLFGASSRATSQPDQHFPSVRCYISHFLTIRYPNLHYQNAEDVKDWSSYSAYDDLIEFEKDIAHLCKAIVLFVESPGSIAELGSFAVIPEITEKLIVFVHSDYSGATSFVSLGPLKRIKESKIHYITWELESKLLS